MSGPPDMINAPPHYQGADGIEAIDVMEQYGLGLHLGTAMAYLLRAGRKVSMLLPPIGIESKIDDLRKAEWWIKRWLSGIGERNGVEYASASGDTRGGLCWRDPTQIADAFGLRGAHRSAALQILGAAVFLADSDEEVTAVRGALNAIHDAIADAERGEAGAP